MLEGYSCIFYLIDFHANESYFVPSLRIGGDFQRPGPLLDSLFGISIFHINSAGYQIVLHIIRIGSYGFAAILVSFLFFSHFEEAQVGYDFDVVAVNWYTNIGGNDGRRSNGKRAYSSYVSATAPFRLGGIYWNATIGVTPWETTFYNNGCDGFEVSELSLGASKTIRVTERFGLPLSAKAIWNPATENAYFTVGLSL